MRTNAVNLAIFTNALCHLNATPLSVAMLAPCAWGENLACGGVWQSVVNSATHNTANSAWQVLAGKTKRGDTANSARGQCGRCLLGEVGKAKMGACLGRGLLSLSRCSHFWQAFGLNLKGFFAHFIVVLFRFILDFAHFIAISFHLIVNFSYFIAVLSRIFVAFSHLFAIAFRFIVILSCLFAYKRHFLGHYAFLKFLNALFLGFLRLSLRAVFAKTAWQSTNLALFLLFGLPRSLCSLAMTADFVILSLCKKTKNPYKLKENLPFLDTSLCPV